MVAVSDRDVRRAWTETLSGAGYTVRSVSRAAELAKALSDGRARLVIRSGHANDAALVARTDAPVLSLDAALDSDLLRGRIHEALAQKGER